MVRRRWGREPDLPSLNQLEKEHRRLDYRRSYGSSLLGTIYTLIIVAGVSMLASSLLISALRIYSDSMEPTLASGDTVIAVRTKHFRRGDVAAFYYNNKIMVKRVIALPGEMVEIDESGKVTVNKTPLEEPYVKELSLGECDIRMPYEVPEKRLFVMGDNRLSSADSRAVAIGCVSEEQLIGRVIARVWPWKGFGAVR